MRKLVILLLMAAIVLPAFTEEPLAGKRITVEQLERALAGVHDRPDADVARLLTGFVLTERLSQARQARLEEDLPGIKAQQALTVLADVSSFLDLPVADIPATASLDSAAQNSLLALTRDYAGKTISRLPNLFATRDTTSFENTPAVIPRFGVNAVIYKPLHFIGESSVTVLYRDGHEIADAAGAKSMKFVPANHELRTMGEFGPVLATVLGDAAKGKVLWSHWEQDAAGPLAVFSYTVPQRASHYRVSYLGGAQEEQRYPAYRGEIAVNPADGSILRLTLVAEMKSDDPMTRAGLLVEYAPVNIGRMTYICPVKSVALFQAPITTVDEIDGKLYITHGPQQTNLNSTLFKQYHLFRAETRILTGDSQEPEGNSPASVPASAPSSAPAKPPRE